MEKRGKVLLYNNLAWYFGLGERGRKRKGKGKEKRLAHDKSLLRRYNFLALPV